jgi:hypothetical protein
MNYVVILMSFQTIYSILTMLKVVDDFVCFRTRMLVNYINETVTAQCEHT